MKKIDTFLNERKRLQNTRHLTPISERLKNGQVVIEGTPYWSLNSNDYLGLSNENILVKAAAVYLSKWGMGSTGSRLLSGDAAPYHQLENVVAKLTKKPAALIFNSGYQANIGVISACFDKNDIIFADKYIHASIVDGILLSGAKLVRFRHNDLDHLDSLLKKNRDQGTDALIISESIFSMHGDRCDLPELVRLKDQYQCHLMIDEAHALGLYGKSGAGLVQAAGLSSKVDFIVGTFGKSIAGSGAFVSCSSRLSQFLINACRSFTYSTALPPSIIGWNLASLAFIADHPERAERLHTNVKTFKTQLASLETPNSTHILPIRCASNEAAIGLSEMLKSEGFWANPIRHPTVPIGQEMIRLSITAQHNHDMLTKLVQVLKTDR
ncbi:MAG: 8-amino-7-oxononanoate synthase [Candidatus Marinamargulisbacteria bacterium]|jgi:8-amino-7-oxononanoate synthase